MAITAAIFCLFFSAFNDLFFRAFARKPRSKGLFVALVGVIWLLIALCDVDWDGPRIQWGPTILWGCISGFFSAAGNILLLEALTGLEAGIGSTLYRLNLVPTVLGASIILGESVATHQWCGILLAVAAVIIFYPWGQTVSTDKSTFRNIAFGMAVLASLMRAGMGLSYRFGFLHGADRAMVVVINALFWIFGGLLYGVFREKSGIRPEKKVVLYGLLSGAMVAGIVISMALSLQYGEASIVLPIAQMSFLLTALFGVIFLKEKIAWNKIAALAAGTAAILLLSL